jgi:hypothetical protein
MNLKIGDVVRFRKDDKSVSGCSSPIYADLYDAFEIINIVEDEKYYSKIGIFIKSIPCPCCGYYNHTMQSYCENGFDSGWFEPLLIK